MPKSTMEELESNIRFKCKNFTRLEIILFCGVMLLSFTLISYAAFNMITISIDDDDSSFEDDSTEGIIERLTGSEVIDIQQHKGKGLALTEDGQACYLQKSSISCFDNLHDAIAINYDRKGNCFILRENGIILSLNNYDPLATVKAAIEQFGGYENLSSIQAFGIYGCCEIITIGNSIPLIDLQA